MEILDRIEKLLASPDLRLHDREGAPVPSAVFRQAVHAVSRHLRRHVPPGGKVAVRLGQDWPALACAMACMATGRVYLPLGPDWPEHRIEQIRASSRFDLLLDVPACQGILAGPAAGEPGPPATLDPEATLYIIYTSGSTGEPKGVMISRRSYACFLRFLDQFFPRVGPGDNLLQVARFTFDMSLLDLGMLLGRQVGHFFSAANGSAFRLALEIEDYGITWIDAVPNQVGMIMEDGVCSRADLSSLRHLVLGGSRFPWQLLQSLRSKLGPGVDLVNAYGPTETTIYTHFKRFTGDPAGDAHDGTLSAGGPVPGVIWTLVDPLRGREIQEPYARGELLLGGELLMQGYCNDPERTARCLFQMGGSAYYRTGDLAYRNEAGEIFIVGRTDETLKRRGYRVNLLDIDSYIQRLPGVQQCMTLAYPADGIDHYILAVVQPRSGHDLDPPGLKRQLASVLVEYQIPDAFAFHPGLPLNGSGKLSRKALMEEFRPLAEAAIRTL